MAGYAIYLRLRRFEESISELGLRMAYPKNYRNPDVDTLALYPAGTESFPIYCRDAELFSGTLEQAEIWIRGIEWARNYDDMIGISNKKKRANRENLELQRQLIAKLKQENKIAQKP